VKLRVQEEDAAAPALEIALRPEIVTTAAPVMAAAAVAAPGVESASSPEVGTLAPCVMAVAVAAAVVAAAAAPGVETSM